jgi:hypothetical protein
MGQYGEGKEEGEGEGEEEGEEGEKTATRYLISIDQKSQVLLHTQKSIKLLG